MTLPETEQIEAVGDVITNTSIIDHVILGAILVIIIVVVFLGKRLIEAWMAKINNDGQATIIKLNNENQQITNETNELVKEIAKSRDVIEKTIYDQDKRIEKLETGYQAIGNMEKMLHDAVLDRKKRHTALEKEMKTVKTNVKDIFPVLTDHTKEMLIHTLYSENKRVKIKDKLKSYLRLVGLRVNGEIKEYGHNIILHNKESWIDILRDMGELRITVLDEKHFHDTLEEINHKIFDGMMW
jgi:septal ring factor EnvC (AmiA/AmiB activator)